MKAELDSENLYELPKNIFPVAKPGSSLQGKNCKLMLRTVHYIRWRINNTLLLSREFSVANTIVPKVHGKFVCGDNERAHTVRFR